MPHRLARASQGLISLTVPLQGRQRRRGGHIEYSRLSQKTSQAPAGGPVICDPIRGAGRGRGHGKQIRKRPSSEPQTLSVKNARDPSPFPRWGRRSPERLSGTGSHAVSRRQVCLNPVLTSFTEASAAVPDARSSGLEF
uniref:Uncharacterized protein n=1 Tax=Rousettus aegyptiacus TaxID=9407 RepID=A0A7J8E8H6_ROUAE|nr:hypothetical protein HJG63_008106 [Rousettus aegyptiacus]